MYEKCVVCGQFINTETTDHVVDSSTGKERLAHVRPCAEQLVVKKDDPNVHTVHRHQHRS